MKDLLNKLLQKVKRYKQSNEGIMGKKSINTYYFYKLHIF